MPLKWKIFFGMNFLLALPAFILLIVISINFSTTYNDEEDNIYLVMAVSGLAMIIVNGFLNIYIIQRFFPDKLITSRVKKINSFSLIITAIISIGLLAVCFYGASMEFSASNTHKDVSGKITLVILMIFLLMQVIVLVMQAQLPGLIGRNTRQKMQSLIDSIGNAT